MTIMTLFPWCFRTERISPLPPESHGFLECRVVSEASRDFAPPGIPLLVGAAQVGLEFGDVRLQRRDSLFQVDGGHPDYLSGE
jgi:hypothetical protein